MFLLIGFARSFAKAEWQPVPWRGAVLACLAVLASFGAQGAQTACTPQAGFTACTQFSYSGVDQTFTVPAGITTLNFKAWGAGAEAPSPIRTATVRPAAAMRPATSPLRLAAA
ncbi:hypothetical protein RCH10_002025 [Variovorax sp. GrIS 2.14]|uniref:hypothetical protein n=1 Tax=Variovorax sp. GrIS 2.14 TaxID=3071709 RepID=UPI0038F6BB24